VIPSQLQTLVESQRGRIHRVRREAVTAALSDLKVPVDSEFAEFFFTYTITFFRSEVSDEELCDIAEPTAEIAVGTKFVHEVWEIPEQFVCFSSGQGEGRTCMKQPRDTSGILILHPEAISLLGNSAPNGRAFLNL